MIRVEATPWGSVYVAANGDRYRLTPMATGPDHRELLPRWERPTAAFLRATPDQRWGNYRAIALAELDAEFPN